MVQRCNWNRSDRDRPIFDAGLVVRSVSMVLAIANERLAIATKGTHVYIPGSSGISGFLLRAVEIFLATNEFTSVENACRTLSVHKFIR
jgi:hypothetical protein